MTCSVKTPTTEPLLSTSRCALLGRSPVWVNVYTWQIGHMWRSPAWAEQAAEQEVHQGDPPPLYRIKITPKVKP